MAETETAEIFLEKFLKNGIDVMGTGFMMRSKDYDRMGGIPPYPNLLFADFELWIRLTMISFRATSFKECFSFRIHQSTTTVSPDSKFTGAFERFIYFLAELKDARPGFKEKITGNGATFLEFYCRGLSHRLLRTPRSRRPLTVKEFVDKCTGYSKLLGIESQFHPRANWSIRLAILLDKNVIGRALFLGFKKIFRRPVLK